MDGDVLRVLSKWAICLIKSLYTESAEPKGHFIWMNWTPIQNPIQTLRWTMSKWFSYTKASNKLKFNFLRPGWPQMNLVILFRFLELVIQLLQYSRFYTSLTSKCFGSAVPMIVNPEKAHSARFYKNVTYIFYQCLKPCWLTISPSWQHHFSRLCFRYRYNFNICLCFCLYSSWHISNISTPLDFICF